MDIETRKKISRAMKGKSNFEGKRHTHASKIQIKFSMEGHRNAKDHKWVTDKETGEEHRVKGNLPKGMRWGRSRSSFNENFMDGRNPHDKGDMARHGLKGKTLAQLRKIRGSETASPRQKQLAHWYINMHKEEKEVWDNPSPAKKPDRLSSVMKARAKARAKAAGRPYPNLIDNMWAARNEGKDSAKRLEGTDSLKKIYTNATPGQGKKVKVDEAKATYCGRCGTTHVAPKFGGKCPALKEEQVNEISKDLANRYMYAAMSDRKQTDNKISKAIDKNREQFSMRRHGNISKLLKKADKRSAGIMGAIDRLQKEEIEQVAEVSMSTLQSYRQKAHTQIQHYKLAGGKDKPEASSVLAKREPGMATATAKVIKKDKERVAAQPKPAPQKAEPYKPLGGRDEMSGRSYSESKSLQNVAEADKHSMIGKIQRGHELKKKVDTSFADIGKAQQAGDHPAASKAFRKHERYANLERPGTWTKVDEQGVAEGLLQTLRRVVPGYAKREIDKKMDAGKFGRTDVDKDANFQRYKKIQDKLK